MNSDKVLAAILRKTQLRLIDSNSQSQDLASDLDNVLQKLDSKNLNIQNIESYLKTIRKKLASMQFLD
tara:strand:- start:375 stop:578 length:204 start_codon:yes stop_codon:yes gene_type:complete